MRQSTVWLLGFAGIGAIAGDSLVVRWDLHADAWLAHRLHGVSPPLQAVWPLGGPVIAAGLVMAATLGARVDWRCRRLAWALVVGGTLVELGSKILGVGAPVGVPAVPVLPILRFGLHPAFHAVGQAVPAWLADGIDAVRLRSTYPSGHVLRLALIPGFLSRRRGLALSLAVAAAGGVAVVVTGGHTVTDALGGLCLAQAILCFWREACQPSAAGGGSAPSSQTPGAAPS